MAGRGRELRNLLEKTLQQCGVEVYEFGKAPNGHQVVTIEVEGLTRRFCFSNTPSKSTPLVSVQQLKRLVRSCRRTKR